MCVCVKGKLRAPMRPLRILLPPGENVNSRRVGVTNLVGPNCFPPQNQRICSTLPACQLQKMNGTRNGLQLHAGGHQELKCGSLCPDCSQVDMLSRQTTYVRGLVGTPEWAGWHLQDSQGQILVVA